MAVNHAAMMTAEIMGGVFIAVGALFTSMQMAFIYLGMGLTGAWFFLVMYRRLEAQKENREKPFTTTG